MIETPFYRRQIEAHSCRLLADPARRAVAESWMRDDSTDAWRHARMRGQILPLLKPGEYWITIGDGRFGSDAAWLLRKGQRVLCTDIVDDLISIAHERGLVGDYACANAEHLPFATGEFDWVMCKESYHHMPRPPIAFYEMLRVAKKGVVLIEPTPRQPRNLWGGFVHAILSRFYPEFPGFEESGNYIYKLSLHDVSQMLLGIGLRHFAFKAISDSYIQGVEHESPPGRIKRRCERSNRIDRALRMLLGLYGNLGIYVVFKNEPVAIDALRADGFHLITLPANPHLVEGSPR